jgi:Golgi SNAP receptor complex protein 2
MNSLFNHGIKQTQMISKDLLSFEKNVSTSPLSLQGSITTSLTAFKKTIKEYNDLVQQNINDEANAKHETRLAKFNQDLHDFQQKFESLKQQRESLLQEADKQELMGRRTHTTASDNPYEQEQIQAPLVSYQEGLYNEKMSLGRGSQQLDYILEMGQQAFDDIVTQNETLRKLQGKFEEGLITLGVSQGTIRSVEKRAKKDKWLFWGGLMVMMVVFWYIVKWFR